MKKLILVTVGVFFLSQMNAQKKWSFGAEAFPNITNGVVKNTGIQDPSLENSIRESEVPKFCLSGQVYASYNFNAKSSLSFGIGYQNTGEKTNYKHTYFANSIDPRTGFETPEPMTPGSTRAVRFYYNHHNIQLPVLFQYNLTSRLYLKSGLSTVINLTNTITDERIFVEGNNAKNTQTDKSSDFRSIVFSGQFGIGYEYMQKSKFSLYVQPTVEKFLMGIYQNPSINRVPLSLGIVFGVRI